MRKIRTGFTLVELLVVMSLIAIVATMAILFFPNAATANREANAAQQLQSWLNIAKQRAQRNQRPTGVRLYIKQAGDNFFVNSNQFVNVVTECQYIEQPDDFRGAPGTTLATLGLNNGPGAVGTPMMPTYKTVFDVVEISGADLTNGYGTPLYNYLLSNPGSPNLPKVPPGVGLSTYPPGFIVGQTFGYDPNQIYWTVQPCPFVYTGKGYYPFAPNPIGFGGDYLEVSSNGIMHQVIGVLAVSPPAPPFPVITYLQMWPPLANALPNGTSNFRIVRGPRVVGTELLTLPDNTFIDLQTNVLYNNPLPNLANVNANAGTAETGIEGADAGTQGTGLGTTFIDILFSPSGQVITPGVATSNLHLWVRCPVEADANDPTKSAYAGAPGNGQFYGSPTIVSVFVRTGFVGAYPPNPNSADPYSLVK